LKNFNNWVKTVLINQYCVNPMERPAFTNGPQYRGNRLLTNLFGGPRLKVLDLGCGKGGDLNKWGKVGTEEYVGIGTSLRVSSELLLSSLYADVAEKSVQQAQERYLKSANSREYTARFLVLDCFSVR
jgi:mRNA (guanine-N7-)-methyltransferase